VNRVHQAAASGSAGNSPGIDSSRDRISRSSRTISGDEDYNDWEPRTISWGLLIGNLAGNLLPLLALGAGVHNAWQKGFGWPLFAITAIMYVMTALGITVGFHRLFTHRSFKTGPVVSMIAVILGSMALQGPVTRAGSSGSLTSMSPCNASRLFHRAAER
jgi:stearoyl-CoA desaturase (delta-9 desaturase)